MPPKKKLKVSGPRWEYQDDDTWTAYDSKDSAVLEKAFSAKTNNPFVTTNLTFNKGYGTKYEFDFTKMIQTNTDTKKVRTIRRFDQDTADTTSGEGDLKDYQWSWMDDNGLFAAFYDEDNGLIERAYRKDPKSPFKTTALSFNAEYKTPYVFDFQKLEQLNTESNTIRKLQRGTTAKAWSIADYGVMGDSKKADVAAAAAAAAASSSGPGPLDYPTYWTPRKSDVDLVDLDLKSDEAADVLKNFKDTIKRKVTVQSVQRIQNYALWPFYALTRKAMADKYKGDPSEKMLFHGARVRANMDAIINYGFDMRVAAVGLYGVGIYFAVNATYSDHGYVLQNPDKSKEMFICRVTCGQHVPGNGSLRRPPPKDTSAPHGELYDSVTDGGTPNIMHVVFNNAQAYPEYLVKYK